MLLNVTYCHVYLTFYEKTNGMLSLGALLADLLPILNKTVEQSILSNCNKKKAWSPFFMNSGTFTDLRVPYLLI